MTTTLVSPCVYSVVRAGEP